MAKITVNNTEITLLKINEEDYISLTDIARKINPIEPKDVIKNWMRQKNVIKYLGFWEMLYNPDFKGVEFDPLWKEAGENSFTMSPLRWIETTGAIGIIAKQGKNGGTYAEINQLICLSNLENINSVLIEDGIKQNERLEKLNQIAIHQMTILEGTGNRIIESH